MFFRGSAISVACTLWCESFFGLLKYTYFTFPRIFMRSSALNAHVHGYMALVWVKPGQGKTAQYDVGCILAIETERERVNAGAF